MEKLERWPKYRREQREIPPHKLQILRESSREVLCHSPLLSLQPRQAAGPRVPALRCGDMIVCWNTLTSYNLFSSVFDAFSLSHISISLPLFSDSIHFCHRHRVTGISMSHRGCRPGLLFPKQSHIVAFLERETMIQKLLSGMLLLELSID